MFSALRRSLRSNKERKKRKEKGSNSNNKNDNNNSNNKNDNNNNNNKPAPHPSPAQGARRRTSFGERRKIFLRTFSISSFSSAHDDDYNYDDDDESDTLPLTAHPHYAPSVMKKKHPARKANNTTTKNKKKANNEDVAPVTPKKVKRKKRVDATAAPPPPVTPDAPAPKKKKTKKKQQSISAQPLVTAEESEASLDFGQQIIPLPEVLPVTDAPAKKATKKKRKKKSTGDNTIETAQSSLPPGAQSPETFASNFVVATTEAATDAVPAPPMTISTEPSPPKKKKKTKKQKKDEESPTKATKKSKVAVVDGDAKKQFAVHLLWQDDDDETWERIEDFVTVKLKPNHSLKAARKAISKAIQEQQPELFEPTEDAWLFLSEPGRLVPVVPTDDDDDDDDDDVKMRLEAIPVAWDGEKDLVKVRDITKGGTTDCLEIAIILTE